MKNIHGYYDGHVVTIYGIVGNVNHGISIWPDGRTYFFRNYTEFLEEACLDDCIRFVHVVDEYPNNAHLALLELYYNKQANIRSCSDSVVMFNE